MDSLLASQCLANLEDNEFDEEIINCVKQMTHPREAFYKAKEIKDEGNKLFRKGDFRQAVLTYEKAYQFLSVGEPLHDQDVCMMMDLATSLSLNLAACGLKLGDVDKTITFSTYTLDFDPKNVKAFFRRAVAYVKMDRLDDALKDLEQAIEYDPNNQEVLEELKKVEIALGCTSNQRKEKQEMSVSIEGHDHSSAGETSTTNSIGFHEGNLSSDRGGESMRDHGVVFSHDKEMWANHEKSPVLSHSFKSNSMSCVEDRTTPSPMKSPACPMDTDGVDTSTKLTFRSKWSKSGYSLSLSKTSYDLLIKGKQLEFYDSTGMSQMTVRIRKIEKSTSESSAANEMTLMDEDQQEQRESQVQPPNQELEKIVLKEQGYEVTGIPQLENVLQESTISEENSCNETTEVYCPKKFKRLKLLTNRVPFNFSNFIKKRNPTKPCRHKVRRPNKNQTMSRKRKQWKVSFDEVQNHFKRRLCSSIGLFSMSEDSCSVNVVSFYNNSDVRQVVVGDAMVT